jgi:hypothetical protein
VAYRIWAPLWRDEAIFARLVSWLTETDHQVGEVALFNSYIHVPGRELAEVDRLVVGLADRIPRLRKAGIESVGINVIGTMGHSIHRGVRPMPFETCLTLDGEATDLICPTGEQFRHHTVELYRRMATAGPAFVWMDDDMRFDTNRACFCERCLSAFGWTEGREALRDALRSADGADLRRRWSGFLAELLTAICREIAQAVNGVDPSIDVGIMTVGHSCTTYGNYPIREMFLQSGATKSRPGHGYYRDDPRGGIIAKTLDVARQVRELPEGVDDIQFELENWPYTTLDKSVRTVTNECAAAIQAGCNGIAFNALSEACDRFDEYLPLSQAVGAEQGVWDRLVRASEGTELRGFWPADHTEMVARRWDVADWPRCGNRAEYNIHGPLELAEFGIPMTASPSASCGALLCGRIAEAFDEGALRSVLARGAYLDEKALAVLWTRGLGELAGVRPGEQVFTCFERLAEHRLNGSLAGDGRRAMHFQDYATLLEPVGEGVEVLASAVASDGWRELGPCMTAFSNELGGRVVVSTYAPWHWLGRVCKRAQLQNVFDWLAGGRMPVRIDGAVRVWPMVRTTEAGDRAVVLLQNMALDPTGLLPVRLAGDFSTVVRLTAEGDVEIPARADDGLTHLKLPSLAPWEQAILLLQ